MQFNHFEYVVAKVSKATQRIAQYWLKHMLRMYDMPHVK